MEATKVCSNCKVEKPRSEFHNNKSEKDGKNNWCKFCRNTRVHPRVGVLLTEITCITCNKTKGVDEFSKHLGYPGGKLNVCKSCVKYLKENFYNKGLTRPKKKKEKPLKIKKRNRREIDDGLGWHERQQILRQIVISHLLANHCVDCGEDDIMVLEFDHVRGQKISSISNLVRKSSPIPDLVAEIEKCDVRCANCHRRKTHMRIMGWRYLASHEVYDNYDYESPPEFD